MNPPVVAIIANSLTPYRLHFHRRLVRELPEWQWWSLFTHDVSNAPWALTEAQEIRPVRFGQGERADDQAKLSRALHEYRKGGRIIRWLKDYQAKAVVLLGYNDFGRLRILSWCYRNRVPCLMFGDSNIYGEKIAGLKGRIKQWVLPRVLRKCSAVLACGRLGREYFRRYGVTDEKIFYMPYEPDYEMVAGLTERDISNALAQFNLPTNRDFILYCGRLVSVKRVDILLDAFAKLSERPTWDLVIVGDGPLLSELQNRVPMEMRQRVHWLGFINDQRSIAAVERASKILVLPSDFEPWGVVINEATVAGCAIIATEAVGAAAELVRDGVNGRIVPCGDANILCQALCDVTQPGLIERLQSGSLQMLADWRKQADPVRGLASALMFVKTQNQIRF